MPLSRLVEKGYLALADAAFARWPVRIPSSRCVRQCRLIAHRGEHGTDGVLENSLAAFERAEAAGVWGIELDVRWTGDGVPVVTHDADLMRLHGSRHSVAHLSWNALQACCGSIPSLATVVSRFGGRLHLMIELKKPQNGTPPSHYEMLLDVLAPLKPIRDYHLLSLHTDMLTPLRGTPSRALVAIAYYFPGRLSRWVLDHRWGGICSHYLLMPTRMVKRHHHNGQWVGTGYADSRNVLFRELNRGVHWIFSNRATAMQRVLNTTHQPVKSV